MTARPSNIGSFEWAEEASFAEDSATVDTRMILRNTIDVSGLARPMEDRGGTFQYHGEGDASVPGGFDVGTFTTEFDLYGHGSATNGSLTETALCTLLGHVLGGKNVASVGGLLTTGTNDQDTLTSTNATLNEGAIFRVGDIGDGRAEGQLTRSPTGSSPWELDVALPASPTTADAIRAMQMVYPVSASSNDDITSDSSTVNNTIRARLQTANNQYICHGVAPQNISISQGLNPAEVPRISVTWQTAHWETVNDTFPDATSTADKAPAPTGAGSFFIQDEGTATRNTVNARDISIDLGINIIPLRGPGGVHEGQSVIGYRRMDGPCTISFSVEAEAAGTSTWWDYFSTDPNSIAYKHIAYLLNPSDGRAIGIYFPRCKPIGQVPTQAEIESLNYIPLQFQALTDTGDTTSELTLARFVIGLG